MAESIIYPEHFSKYFCMFDRIVAWIASNTTLSLSAFECKYKGSYIVLSLLCVFLSTKTNGVTNQNALNSVNHFLNLFLIEALGILKL